MPNAKPGGRLVLLATIPAPCGVRTCNHLARLSGRRFTVLFAAASNPRRRWSVPPEQMDFDWRFLSKSDESSLLTTARAAGAMLLFLARSQPQAVICGGYDTLAAWTAFAWCKALGRQFVLWIESNSRDRRKPGRIRAWLKKLIVSGADSVAAPGKASVEYAERLGARRDRIFLSPSAIDNEFFAREARKVDAAREKKLRGYPPKLILYSGRLVREKGIVLLMEAFRAVSSQLTDAGLLIVGYGPEQKTLVHLRQTMNLQRIHFAGPQEYDRMPYFYALADVLVLPTFSDTWGLVVNEAFACGVPAIVSRVAGACDDLIIEGETGFAVEPGDAAELARKLTHLLQDEALRASMGSNCRQLIQKYSPEACAEALLAAALGTSQLAAKTNRMGPATPANHAPPVPEGLFSPAPREHS